jgi:predicted transcriptional regulator
MSEENTEIAGTKRDNIIDLAAGIVVAYVTKNILPARELPGLLTSVHAALAGLGGAGATVAEGEMEIEKPSPAQIRKSISPDALISFIDGKPYKTLKRHLGTHRLDPHSYRHRYGLPDDYPMIALNYAARRSDLAKSLGFGRQKFVRK